MTSLLFFASVLFHELMHSLVALREGMQIESITLFILGGVSQIKGEPKTPGDEFALLPIRVSSGPRSPPTILPAAFCTAWQEAQKDSPYSEAPAVASAGAPADAADFSAPGSAIGVLCAIRNAVTSRASSSLRPKVGMVAVEEYACGFLIQA